MDVVSIPPSPPFTNNSRNRVILLHTKYLTIYLFRCIILNGGNAVMFKILPRTKHTKTDLDHPRVCIVVDLSNNVEMFHRFNDFKLMEGINTLPPGFNISGRVAAEYSVEDGKKIIDWLRDQGIKEDEESNLDLALTESVLQ